jgi:hypothetical protein
MDHTAEIISTSFQGGANASGRFANELGNLRRELTARAGASSQLAAAIRAMRRAEAALRRPLRLAVVGESNSGKSTLTNLLLGVTVLPTLQVANTRVPTLIRYGRSPSTIGVLEDGGTLPLTVNSHPPDTMVSVQVELPLVPLQTCEIVDFPGFFDPLLGYDDIDLAGHGIDAAVWCTFSTQAWKESERSAWQRLPPSARKYGILAITNMDRLKDDQAAKVTARLEKVARADFRDFAYLSAMEAQQAFNGDGIVTDSETWRGSGAAGLHQAVGRLLHDLRRDRLRKVQAITGRMTASALQRLST